MKAGKEKLWDYMIVHNRYIFVPVVLTLSLISVSRITSYTTLFFQCCYFDLQQIPRSICAGETVQTRYLFVFPQFMCNFSFAKTISNTLFAAVYMTDYMVIKSGDQSAGGTAK